MRLCFASHFTLIKKICELLGNPEYTCVMLNFLKAYFHFCDLAFKEIKPSKGGKLMKVI